jgi:hypothetical protein
MAIVLTEAGEATVAATPPLWVTPADAQRLSGFELKPEGMCRDELCVPLPADALRDGRLDLAAFWERLGNPVVHDEAGEVWVLGNGADERNTALAGRNAPDFTLPDLAGVPHRLADLHGRKVLLVSWASW